MRYETIPIITQYLDAGSGYDELIKEVADKSMDDDYVFISETPISTIESNLVDESTYHAGIIATLITELWCRYLWGYILCPLLGYKKRTIQNLRRLPKEARNHKQFILEHYGLKHALQPTSEAGVDLSNVPEHYVSLLPENPEQTAKTIKNRLENEYDKKVDITIIDSDATYKLHNTLFTTLPKSITGIRNNTGVFGYILQAISKKLGPSILATTLELPCEEIIELARIAEEEQTKNSEKFFETVYDMEDEFKTESSQITGNMLKNVKHVPAIIIRKNYLYH
ncbi:MAG: hypothetical protein BZ136_06150 [Methanosphaera sp. rholeuAM74]|nr:MAG: hypothetical protein BZ136_06150 [Methanosphaera sp. rholeuAM74]